MQDKQCYDHVKTVQATNPHDNTCVLINVLLYDQAYSIPSTNNQSGDFFMGVGVEVRQYTDILQYHVNCVCHDHAQPMP